jgi:hypothetical protein
MVYTIRVSATLSVMTEDLITVSKRSNSTFIMLCLLMRMTLTTFVVNEFLIPNNDLLLLHV